MPPTHGTYYGYTRGCRCDTCTAASTRMKKKWLLNREVNGMTVRVPVIGSRRRVQALITFGWPKYLIGQELGNRSRGTIDHILYRAGDTITKDLHDRVVVAFNHLSATPGPAPKSRAYGKRMGWPPPLAWDEDTIDTPAGKPTGVRTETYRPYGTDLDEWWFLVTAGEDPARAASRLGVEVATMERAAQRAGRNELAAVAACARRRWSTAS